MTTPYIGYGNDTLHQQPQATKGDVIRCPSCEGTHVLECGTDTKTGEESGLLLFYKCGESTYLAGVAGRLVTGVEPDVSGSLGAETRDD